MREDNRHLYDTEYFAKNYYKDYKKKSFFAPKRKYLERDRDIFNLLNPQKKDVILEIGCADGTTSKKISGYVHRVIAVDFAEEAITLALKENPDKNITYKLADATDLSFFQKNYVNKIAAIDFVEHVSDETLKKMLKASYTLLKKGGTLSIYTPQRLHWAEIIKHILKTDPTHIRVRTPRHLLLLAKKAGFDIDLLYFSPNPYSFLRYLDKILSCVPLLNNFFRFRICLRLKK